MRELVIERIKSNRYYLALVNMGEITPVLSMLSNEDLLHYYTYCMSHTKLKD